MPFSSSGFQGRDMWAGGLVDQHSQMAGPGFPYPSPGARSIRQWLEAWAVHTDSRKDPEAQCDGERS